MGNFLRHEPCPTCGSRDNLGRYEDGSAWCFGCGHYEPPQKKRAEKALKTVYKPLLREEATLPPTWTKELILRGLNEFERGLFTYSPEMDRILFRIGDFVEARSFTKQPKTLAFGQKVFHVFGEGEPIVLVEDLFSAIRVGRVTSSVSLFGSVLPLEWMRLLTRLTKNVILWLDEDKYREAIKQARSLRLLGLDVQVINTPLDPKAYSEVEIKKLVDKPKEV